MSEELPLIIFMHFIWTAIVILTVGAWVRDAIKEHIDKKFDELKKGHDGNKT